MSERSGITRRDFNRAAAGAAAGAAALALSARSYARAPGANERARLAIVGCGERGRAIAAEVQALAAAGRVEIAALCDLRAAARDRAAAEARALGAGEPLRFQRTEDLHAAKGIDAVAIATPDHQHARQCIEAVKAGRDVYVERPFAHFLDDAVEAHRAVLNSGRLVQVGTVRRSSPRYRAAAEFVRSGGFGEVVAIELRRCESGRGLWRHAAESARLREEDLDWKRFRLHLPEDRFDARKALEFRLFWPYSSGIAGQWLAELVDLVPWFTGDPFPKSCVASGGVHAFRDGRENPDTFSATYEYPRGFQVTFHGRLWNSDGGIGEVLYSRRGKLDLRSAVASGDGAGDLDDPSLAPLRGPLRFEGAEEGSPLRAHLKNFLECLRTRRSPNADIETGFLHSVALCMAVEALHSGRKIGYDPTTEKLTTL